MKEILEAMRDGIVLWKKSTRYYNEEDDYNIACDQMILVMDMLILKNQHEGLTADEVTRSFRTNGIA
jgi:hypothetical protein